MDLGIVVNSVINIQTNAVMTGFFLIDLRAACSPEVVLNTLEYPRQLMNHTELVDMSSMEIAPGFKA